MIRSVNGKTPRVHPAAYVNEMAYVVGDVEIGEDSTVWPSAVIRGDDGQVRIGRDTHVQDGTIIHTFGPSQIGDHVNIGHSVVVHSARIGDCCLIGNNATLLEYCEVGDYCVIGSNAVVLSGTKVPSHSFVVGAPAQIRPLAESQKRLISGDMRHFAELGQQYKAQGL